MHAKLTRDRKKLFTSRMQQTIQTLERYNQTMRNQLDGMLRGSGLSEIERAGGIGSSSDNNNASGSGRGKSSGTTAAELSKTYQFLNDFSSSDVHNKIMQAAFSSGPGPMSGLNIMGLGAGSLSNAANGVKGTSWDSSA